MPIHPLWRPFEQPSPEQIRNARTDPDNEQRWTRAVKAGLIYDIYERIFAADRAHPHDPQPRLTDVPTD